MSEDLLRRHLQDLPYFRALLRSVEARLMRSIEFAPPVLDVGCGDGHFASVAFNRCLEVGVDPSLGSLLEAKTRHAYHTLIVADGARLPYPDGTFASGLSNSVLEHIPNLDGVLGEVSRVLRPGAVFAFSVPNPGYRDELSIPRILEKFRLGGVGRAYRDWFMWITRTVNLLDEDGWEARLDAAGFDLAQSRRYFSPASLRMLEWGHYFGVPSVLARELSGRWLLVARPWNVWPTEKLLRGFYEEPPTAKGTYTFYVARKR